MFEHDSRRFLTSTQNIHSFKGFRITILQNIRGSLSGNCDKHSDNFTDNTLGVIILSLTVNDHIFLSNLSYDE